jgi:hypothetical protein
MHCVNLTALSDKIGGNERDFTRKKKPKSCHFGSTEREVAHGEIELSFTQKRRIASIWQHCGTHLTEFQDESRQSLK